MPTCAALGHLLAGNRRVRHQVWGLAVKVQASQAALESLVRAHLAREAGEHLLGQAA